MNIRKIAIGFGVVLAILVLALAVFFFSFLGGGEETCFDSDGPGPQIEVCN